MSGSRCEPTSLQTKTTSCAPNRRRLLSPLIHLLRHETPGAVAPALSARRRIIAPNTYESVATKVDTKVDTKVQDGDAESYLPPNTHHMAIAG